MVKRTLSAFKRVFATVLSKRGLLKLYIIIYDFVLQGFTAID
jgi:hypothetical protein